MRKKVVIIFVLFLVCVTSCGIGRKPGREKMEMYPESLIVNGEKGSYEVSSNRTIRMYYLTEINESNEVVRIATEDTTIFDPYGGPFDLGWLKVCHDEDNPASIILDFELNETGATRNAVLRIDGNDGDWYFPERGYYIYQESN